MIDTTINLPTLMALLSIGVGLVAWFIRLEGRVTANKDALAGQLADLEKLNSELQLLRGLVELHKNQFHDYQLAAAKEFMTQAAFAEIKRELISEIGRMEGRLEAQIGRLGRPGSARSGRTQE